MKLFFTGRRSLRMRTLFFSGLTCACSRHERITREASLYFPDVIIVSMSFRVVFTLQNGQSVVYYVEPVCRCDGHGGL
eukprot:scaffold25588_cov40-Tisochrysis_lutea.AAC.3